MYRIDCSMNDAPYQGIHVFNDEKHVGTFWEDDAPVHEFNSMQRVRAQILCDFMNSDGYDPSNLDDVWDALEHMKFIKPHERIKL